MRWSKIKNIMIVLLVIVNGFLLAQVGLRSWKSRRSEQESRERMVAILARNGVDYLPQEVPGDLTLEGCRLTLTPFGEAEAALLVGDIAHQETRGTQTLYTGAQGTVSCSTLGEVTVSFSGGGELSEAELLDRLSQVGVDLQRPRGEGTGYTQLYGGAPVSNETALLTLSPGACQATFRYLAGEAESLSAAETVTASTALARLLNELSRGGGYVCSQITAMYPGYLAEGTGVVTLTPAWLIETDTWRFGVDGYTGAVTAME